MRVARRAMLVAGVLLAILASPASAASVGTFAAATWVTHPSEGVTVRTVLVAQTKNLYGGRILYVEQETITATSDTDVEGTATAFTFTHSKTAAYASGIVPGIGAVTVAWTADGPTTRYHSDGSSGTFTPARARGTVGSSIVRPRDEYPGTGIGRVVVR